MAAAFGVAITTVVAAILDLAAWLSGASVAGALFMTAIIVAIWGAIIFTIGAEADWF